MEFGFQRCCRERSKRFRRFSVSTLREWVSLAFSFGKDISTTRSHLQPLFQPGVPFHTAVFLIAPSASRSTHDSLFRVSFRYGERDEFTSEIFPQIFTAVAVRRSRPFNSSLRTIPAWESDRECRTSARRSASSWVAACR